MNVNSIYRRLVLYKPSLNSLNDVLHEVLGGRFKKGFAIENPFQGTIFSEGKVSGVVRVAVGDKNFKVVPPGVEFDAIIGKHTHCLCL